MILCFENYVEENDPALNCLDNAIITAPKKRKNETLIKLKNIAGRVLNNWRFLAKIIKQYGLMRMMVK